MQTDTDCRSILVADCGTERTRVTLIDLVEGNEYRMVGQQELPTTAEPPFSDVTVAVQQAIVELERSTGRRLLEQNRLRIPQGRDGQGLDAFVATCSAGGSLPVLVLAVTADITARSAVYAAEGTYVVPFRVVTMEEVLRDAPLSEGGEPAPPGGHWWEALEHLHPGGVLLVGGVDGGNVTPLRTLARALGEALPPKPTRIEQELSRPLLPVIYAGNQRAREVVEGEIGTRVDLRIVENVRPRLREEQIQPVRDQLIQLYEDQIMRQVAGYEELASWTQGLIQLPYLGLQLIARFLAMHHGRQVLAVDLGGGATSAVWAQGDQSARVVLGHFGLGRGIGRVLARREARRIGRWLPFALSGEELRDWILNQALRSRTLPVSERDCLIQQAVAREAIAEALEQLCERVPAGFEMIVATGSIFSRLSRWAHLAMVLLDAVQPTGENASGLVDLYVDRSSLLPSVGAVATLNPDAAACVLMRDGLFHLGSCLVPLGRGRRGSRALELELEFPNEMRQHVEVDWGEIQTVPFGWGGEAHLKVRPARGTRIGLGRPGERMSTAGGDRIRGGALGLIIDARGRPLELPAEGTLRRAMLAEWLERSGALTEEELGNLVEASRPVEAVEEPPETADG